MLTGKIHYFVVYSLFFLCVASLLMCGQRINTVIQLKDSTFVSEHIKTIALWAYLDESYTFYILALLFGLCMTTHNIKHRIYTRITFNDKKYKLKYAYFIAIFVAVAEVQVIHTSVYLGLKYMVILIVLMLGIDLLYIIQGLAIQRKQLIEVIKNINMEKGHIGDLEERGKAIEALKRLVMLPHNEVEYMLR